MFEVEFCGSAKDDCLRIPLTDASTTSLLTAKDRIETEIGHALPVNTRTGFPSFTLYQDGQEIGGG